nr:MAG TPA: hypothetical protein [Caudoviricetes sp.]
MGLRCRFILTTNSSLNTASASPRRRRNNGIRDVFFNTGYNQRTLYMSKFLEGSNTNVSST